MRLFSNLFSSESPLFLLEIIRFASIEDSLGFLALCDLLETFFRIYWRHFSETFIPKMYFFSFLRGFLLNKTVFSVPRITSDLVFLCCGTELSFLNNCEKDLQHCATFFRNSSSGKLVPFPFYKIFNLKKKRFAILIGRSHSGVFWY